MVVLMSTAEHYADHMIDEIYTRICLLRQMCNAGELPESFEEYFRALSRQLGELSPKSQPKQKPPLQQAFDCFC